MAELLVHGPDGWSQRVALSGTMRFGRADDLEIRLPFKGISRVHGCVEAVDGGWRVRDLGSRNGVWTDGKRVESVLLGPGQEVVVGPVRIVLEDGAVSGTAQVVSTMGALSLLDLPSPDELSDPEALRRGYDVLRAAHQLGHVIGMERDLDALLRAILAFCSRVLPAEHAVALLADGEDGALRVRAHRSRGSSGVVAPPRSVLRELKRTGRGVLARDASRETRFAASASIADLGVRSILAVPLRVEGEVAGAIVLDNRDEEGAFSTHDLHLLLGIAAQASLALERARLVDRVGQEAELRGRLAQFLAPEVVEQVVDGRLALERGGRSAEVSVLFADLRGFTALASELGPRASLELLNVYFEDACDAVFHHGGVVDKFVGDELMAIWGVPAAAPDGPMRALRCAVDILERLARRNRQREVEGLPLIRCGIGINSGEAMVGLLGSSRQFQYTVIGDTVNVASRLCGLAGEGEVVLPRAGFEVVPGLEVEAMQPASVKGKRDLLDLLRVRVGC